ncbi:YbaB/EbfC family nucleoid-associated protein [Nonomuraea cavernae]|uniref:Uncharacterized protein n=1 Tax=Nonomuraea cavernae TaxID=2045107 RepID=A0A917YYM3_9ACTN|nr:YbaB/EbfC family nucleoid-associated protein [Nonomuraea cavernae]MCA2187280.1 YbaB/EbfC family nucleoid-associated protein [Nonomuraea cavernae]GGO68131.1 hypothetical protein GCM10012289_26180 [Nonomuraea cavernae]
MNDRRPTEASHSGRRDFPGRRESAPSLSGHGVSEDKSVSVAIGGDGLVERITIDPRVLRGGSEAVAELARDAMRRAQEDWFRHFAQAEAPARAEEARKVQERLRQRLDELEVKYEQRLRELQGTFNRSPKHD